MQNNYIPKFNPGDVIGIKGWIGYYTVVDIKKLYDLLKSDDSYDFWYSPPMEETVYVFERNGKFTHKIYKDGNEAYAKVDWIDKIAFKVKERPLVKSLYGE